MFKIKTESDGSLRFKTRIVTKGFQQKPGVDYTESFSPVATDTTIRMGFAYALYSDWMICVIDIEASFLEGRIDNPMYIGWPDGMLELGFITQENLDKYVIMLVAGMYGNVDAALRFFKEYKTQLEKMGMKQCASDPCCFIRVLHGKLVLIALTHIDDTVLCGPPDQIAWFKSRITERFKFTDEGKSKKHLGVWYEWAKDEENNPMLVASMDMLVQEIVKATEDHVGGNIKLFDTPGTPNKSLPKNEGEPVDAEKYRSIVGKIMYLVTKLWIGGANVARELTKHFSNPGEEHWQELKRVVGYMKKHKDKIQLVYRKPRDLRPAHQIDGSYAVSFDRRSISGAIFTLGGTVVGWMSKTQPIVAISTAEMEYIVFTPAVQETLFQYSLLGEWGEGQYPAVIMEDNTAAIYLVKNQHVSARTKHIDIKYHFIREHHDKGVFVGLYVKSDDNNADMLTKNQPLDLFEKHSLEVRSGKNYIYTHWDELMEKLKAEAEMTHAGRMLDAAVEAGMQAGSLAASPAASQASMQAHLPSAEKTAEAAPTAEKIARSSNAEEHEGRQRHLMQKKDEVATSGG